MLTIRSIEISDSSKLFYHLSNPQVLKFSRLKPASLDDMERMIIDLKTKEQERKVIPYTILYNNEPIGMITLWDYSLERREGFLATWLGEEHWGKGFNEQVKVMFLETLFLQYGVDQILMIIRDHNIRSIKACNKIKYVTQLTAREEIKIRSIYEDIIEENHLIFKIPKDRFLNKEQEKVVSL